MFAVIKTGGKQYKVAKDDVLAVEKLTAAAGETVTFDRVLMLGGEGNLTVGAPAVEGASVTAEVVEQTRGKKVLVFKKRRRKHFRRKNGHRQDLTLVKITDILASGEKPAKAQAKPRARKAAKAEAAETPAAEESKE